MKLHCKAYISKANDGRLEDGEHLAEARSPTTERQDVSSPPSMTRAPPPVSSQGSLSPEIRNDTSLRSRFHHTFDSSLDYSTHRSQSLLDPLLIQRSNYRPEPSQYPCTQTSHSFNQGHRTFATSSPFQKSIVNGWYTCHSGVDTFSLKQCNEDMSSA